MLQLRVNSLDDTQSLRMWQYRAITCIDLYRVELHPFAGTLIWRGLFTMDYEGRLSRFRQQMATSNVDLAFFSISADLHYLTGIPRDMPNFGAVLYPGRWLEGAFITRQAGPVIVLPRMTSEFHLEGHGSGDVRVLQDRDNPDAVARE